MKQAKHQSFMRLLLLEKKTYKRDRLLTYPLINDSGGINYELFANSIR